jgi:hypothetical protein
LRVLVDQGFNELNETVQTGTFQYRVIDPSGKPRTFEVKATVKRTLKTEMAGAATAPAAAPAAK